MLPSNQYKGPILQKKVGAHALIHPFLSPLLSALASSQINISL